MIPSEASLLYIQEASSGAFVRPEDQMGSHSKHSHVCVHFGGWYIS